MFTVKHVAPNGDEFAIEAESYEVQWDREADLVRVMTYDQKYRDGNYTGLWVGVPARGRNDPSPPDVHAVYVMNRFGSTISTTWYREAPEGHFDHPQQADPELVAA